MLRKADQVDYGLCSVHLVTLCMEMDSLVSFLCYLIFYIMTMVVSHTVVRNDSEHPGDPSPVYSVVTWVSHPGYGRGSSPSRFHHRGDPSRPLLAASACCPCPSTPGNC